MQTYEDKYKIPNFTCKKSSKSCHKKLRIFVHKQYRFAILCKQQHFSTISLPVNKFITKSTDLLSKHALEYLHE